MSLNFMAAVMICSDFGAQENKICTASTFPPSIRQEVMGLDTVILALVILFVFAFNIEFQDSFFTFLFPHQETL